MTTLADRPGPAALWYGLLGAPLAWSLHLVVAYAVVAHRCRIVPDPDEPPVVAIALSAALFAVALGSLATAVANWRAAPAEERFEDTSARATAARIRFMSISGVFVGAVFVLGIAFGSAALFILNPCS